MLYFLFYHRQLLKNINSIKDH